MPILKIKENGKWVDIPALKGTDGTNGENGADGQDGYSPTATVTQTETGATITITDKNGTTTTNITNGKDGEKGEKGDTGEAGAKGDKGEQGEQGEKGEIGETGAQGIAGKDGVSVTHSWDGTTLTVTSASGTSSADLKGEKGDKGDTGETGADGSDYILTDEDKSEIANTIKTEVPLVKSAEQPPFVNSVGEMTDTSKAYVMSDGYFYAYKESENYNLLKISEVSFSSRLQDDVEGITTSNAQNAVTGWMPVEHGKYYCSSVLYNGVRCSNIIYVRINLKLKDGTIVVYNKNTVPYALEYSKRIMSIEHEDAVAVMLHFQINNDSEVAQDIDTSANLGAYQPMLVEGNTAAAAYENAMNLDYVDGDEEVASEWYNTGLAYNQPVDYEDRVVSLETDVSNIETNIAEIEDDIAKLEGDITNPASTSPYYRNVNFGVVPFTYYQGVSTDYESENFGRETTYSTFMEAWKSLIANYSGYVTETTLGTASDGQTIYLYDFKPVRIANQNKDIPKIIIIAGQHGFEKSNIYGLYYFIDNLLNRWSQHPALEYLRNDVELMIIPVLNTYGFDNLTYKNANKVNLNRNYNSGWQLVADTTSDQYGGAEAFDQPETQIVRDLLNNNTDALLVVDFHTYGQTSAEDYANVNWCGLCTSTDDYYNRMRDSIAHHLSAITAHFILDYELNKQNVMMGYMSQTDGVGLLRNWAYDNNFVGVLIEGFNGFPNGTPFIGDVFKANEEIIINYLITAMNYLGK